MLTSDLSFASNQYKDYAEKCFQGWLNPNSTSVCKDLFMQALPVPLHSGRTKIPLEPSRSLLWLHPFASYKHFLSLHRSLPH